MWNPDRELLKRALAVLKSLRTDADEIGTRASQELLIDDIEQHLIRLGILVRSK